MLAFFKYKTSKNASLDVPKLLKNKVCIYIYYPVFVCYTLSVLFCVNIYIIIIRIIKTKTVYVKILFTLIHITIRYT